MAPQRQLPESPMARFLSGQGGADNAGIVIPIAARIERRRGQTPAQAVRLHREGKLSDPLAREGSCRRRRSPERERETRVQGPPSGIATGPSCLRSSAGIPRPGRGRARGRMEQGAARRLLLLLGHAGVHTTSVMQCALSPQSQGLRVYGHRGLNSGSRRSWPHCRQITVAEAGR